MADNLSKFDAGPQSVARRRLRTRFLSFQELYHNTFMLLPRAGILIIRRISEGGVSISILCVMIWLLKSIHWKSCADYRDV
jgi:hypothetical protein